MVDWCRGGEEKRISLSGQVREGEVWDGDGDVDVDRGEEKMERAIGT